MCNSQLRKKTALQFSDYRMRDVGKCFNADMMRCEMEIKIKKLNENCILPQYMTDGSAAMDVYACIENEIVIQPRERVLIPTGFAVGVPSGYAAILCARSGLAYKNGIGLANGIGVIDSDYRGEFIVVLHNHGAEPQEVDHGERIAQLVITPVFTPGFTEVAELTDTTRAGGGFGSTGK